ncbi:alkaline phosphatase family protein [Paenibacillus oryzisoli]|uniref:alkaline phosphatase family protein n=1 Tax=Paenibacillus oryzisoli TaxID=1850517 RepID=UPI003D2DBDB4
MNTAQAIQRVIILGIDGAGAYMKEADTPHIDALLQGGSSTYGAQTVYPSNSGECWGSLLHGVGPEKHKAQAYIQNNAQMPADPASASLFRRVKAAYPNSPMGAFVCWAPILTGAIEELDGVVKHAAPDADLVPVIGAFIREQPAFRLLFVQLDDVDAAGHKHGFGTAGQLQAITRADAQIGEIVRALAAAAMLDDSLIVVTTDHGGGGARTHDHGSDHPKDMTIFWGCRGPGVAAGAELDGVSIRDTAAVALHALGLPLPEGGEAKLPEGLFL